jgi:hypothetical protein
MGVVGPPPARFRPRLRTASYAQVQMREETHLADIDRLARQYTGRPYPQRDRRRISAWIAVDGWHGWGALKDSSQPGKVSVCFVLASRNWVFHAAAQGSSRAIADCAKSARCAAQRTGRICLRSQHVLAPPSRSSRASADAGAPTILLGQAPRDRRRQHPPRPGCLIPCHPVSSVALPGRAEGCCCYTFCYSSRDAQGPLPAGKGPWPECDHLNWPRFGLVSSRISAPPGW